MAKEAVCASCGHEQDDMRACKACGSIRVVLVSIIEANFGSDWRSAFEKPVEELRFEAVAAKLTKTQALTEAQRREFFEFCERNQDTGWSYIASYFSCQFGVPMTEREAAATYMELLLE